MSHVSVSHALKKIKQMNIVLPFMLFVMPIIRAQEIVGHLVLCG